MREILEVQRAAFMAALAAGYAKVALADDLVA